MTDKPFHIPDTVKVGCYVFKVEQVVKVSNERALKGQNRPYDRVILIDSEMKPCDKRDTMWHEILHSLSTFMELNLGETLVSRLAAGVAMVQVDNPELFRPEQEGGPNL